MSSLNNCQSLHCDLGEEDSLNLGTVVKLCPWEQGAVVACAGEVCDGVVHAIKEGKRYDLKGSLFISEGPGWRLRSFLTFIGLSVATS